jgi:hypothetical protein
MLHSHIHTMAKNQNMYNFTTKKNFHSNIKFTTNTSESFMDFLDITIYKGRQFTNVQLLDTKTLQKTENLYQYLFFLLKHYNRGMHLICTIQF